jgi:hypothetical protein
MTMPKYIIERDLPGAGALSEGDLRSVAAKSNAVLRELGPDVRWVESYVTENKIFCVYIAASPDIVREHARKGGFPCDRIAQVVRVIDPTTAEAR